MRNLRMEENLKTYQTANIVNYYTQLNQLQGAEKTLLDLLSDRLSSFKMLDIGVGGGRTTAHFAPVVKEYVGIDYSADMIAACQQKFANSSFKADFKVADARDLSQFADNSFDLILFSFNGIDYVSHSDRLSILQEVARVGKSGGYFFFSSHNLLSMTQEFNYQKHLSLNLFKTYVNLVMFAFLRFANLPVTFKQLQKKDYYIIRDESHNFKLKTYYIRPQAQIKQLQNDFHNIKIYSWQSGQQIFNVADSMVNSPMWLYYLCQVN